MACRHQKLHTNCAPDDIIIAEAYIKFLECNNPDAYWGHLKGNGLSWEYMCAPAPAPFCRSPRVIWPVRPTRRLGQTLKARVSALVSGAVAWLT
jgi:hypothetical protein